MFGHNSSTGGQSFSFNSSLTATNSVTSSQLPNADSKKGGSGAAVGAGKDPATSKPSTTFSLPFTSVHLPTTVSSAAAVTTASPTSPNMSPQDKPKNGGDLEDKTTNTDHRTPSSSDLPKSTASLSTAVSSGGKLVESSKPTSSSLQDEKPLSTPSTLAVSQQAPSVTKTAEGALSSTGTTSSTVDAAKTILNLAASQVGGFFKPTISPFIPFSVNRFR